MPGSVSNRSTGQKAASTRYSNERMTQADPGNPHPMAKGNPPETYGSAGSGMEYREVASAGITQTGVGSRGCNDAACEMNATHPSPEDLSQAGTLGTAKVMRRTK